MRKWLGLLAVTGFLFAGCGGETFGGALQSYCNRFPSSVEDRCEEELINRGQAFLEGVEYKEHIAAEIAGIRAFHP